MVTQPWRLPQSPGGPAELGTRHLFVGHQEKQDKVGQQLTMSPRWVQGCRQQYTPVSHHSVHAPAQAGGGDGRPSHQPHVAPPDCPPHPPPRGWQLTSGSRCILCPAGWSGGGTGGRLQISWLLMVLVILSTPRRCRGICLAAWPGTGGLPWSRWSSYINRLPPRHQRGRDGESGTARLLSEPCLALTQLQQASARLWRHPEIRTGFNLLSQTPPGRVAPKCALGRWAVAAEPGQTLQLTAHRKMAHGLGLHAKRGVRRSAHDWHRAG